MFSEKKKNKKKNTLNIRLAMLNLKKIKIVIHLSSSKAFLRPYLECSTINDTQF